MNNKLIKTSLILLVIVLQAMTIGVNGAGSDFQVVQTFWGTSTSPQEVGPGDRSVTLNIVIQNIGSQAWTGLDANLYLSFPFSNVTGGNQVHGYYAGTVQVSQTATLQFQLNIDASASVGSYSLFFNLNYGPKFALGEGLYAPILLLGRAELKVSANPFSMIPSSMNSLTVSISNIGTGIATKVSMALTFPTGVSVEGDNQWYFQSVAPAENKAIALAVFVQPSLAGSSVQMSVSLTYADAYGAARSANRVVGLKILPMTNVPIAMSVNGSYLIPGALNTLTLNIMNNQSKSISSIQASLVLPASATSGSQALVVVGDNSRFFSSIEPFGSVTLEIRITVPLGAAGMNYQFTLSLSYLDSYNVSRSENHNFGIRVLPLSKDVALVSTSKNVLIAGTFNEPIITVTNSGKAPIYSVTITLLLPTASSSTSSSSPVVLVTGNQWYFDQIQPNGSVTFSPKIFTSLSAIDTSYQVQISINYIDKNEVTRVETKSVGFSIKGLANLEFSSLNAIPRATFAGGNITITGDLLNTGSTRALYTSLSIKPNQYFVQTLDGSMYIGEIATNVISSFSIASRVRPSTANGTYPLTLVFNYQNDYGDKFTVEKTVNIIVGGFVPITPRPTSQPQQLNILTNQYTYIVAAALAVSAIFLIYRRHKRHRE